MSQRPVLPWHKIGLTHEEDDITDGKESAELKEPPWVSTLKNVDVKNLREHASLDRHLKYK